jgi:hypothetical protein
MTDPIRTFERPGGQLWRVYLRPHTEGITGSANLGTEDLVFESEDEEREERVIERYGLGGVPLADLEPGQIADLFAQAQPRRAGQRMSRPSSGKVQVQLQLRGGRSQYVQLILPLPDAVMRPYEVTRPFDLPPGTPTGEFVTRLFRRAPGRAVEMPLYEEDTTYLSGLAPSLSRERCSRNDEPADVFYVQPNADGSVVNVERLCELCYADAVAARDSKRQGRG